MLQDGDQIIPVYFIMKSGDILTVQVASGEDFQPQPALLECHGFYKDRLDTDGSAFACWRSHQRIGQGNLALCEVESVLCAAS